MTQANINRADDLTAERDALRASLQECADDLEAYIEHDYSYRRDYPSQEAKRTRDMEPVVRARAVLAQKETTNV